VAGIPFKTFSLKFISFITGLNQTPSADQA
jgi:hypothetical protein